MKDGTLRRATGAVLVGAALTTSAGALATTLYTQTNGAGDNEVQIYETGPDGALALSGQVSTGGLGTGAGLGNQGALALSGDRHWLFAVNAGSDDISAFAVTPHGLVLVDRVPAGGSKPVSVTTHGASLYALDAGGTGNIAGFRIQANGHLTPIDGFSRPLSSSAAGAAQVGFSPDGETLVVTEKATSRLSTYTLDDGRLRGPFVSPSSGMTPFGFAFDRRGDLIVSEAVGGKPGAATVSSYDVNDDSGALSVVSASVPTNQGAACWIALARHGRFAYATNTGSGTVTGYGVSRSGELTRLSADGITGYTGGGPTDAASTGAGTTMYVLSPSIGQIVAFHVEADGRLARIGSTAGVPATATGLVVR